MSSKKRYEEPAGEKPAAPDTRHRIGIFLKPWKMVTSYGVNSTEKHVQAFGAGQMILNEDAMKSLIAQGAPLRIYVHDVEPSASGID